MVEKRLFLFDAMALIYNAYRNYGSLPMYSANGTKTSVVYGFMLELNEIIRLQKPTHIAFAFDVKKPTFRHQLYSKYKAHRQPMPDEIAKSIPIIRKIIDLMHIQTFEMEGFEADDVIGTIAKKAVKSGFKVYLVTPDKDFCQLVENKIFMYKPKKSGKGVRIMGVNEVCSRYSIAEAIQFIDLMALCGDASDNIPGIRGISPKQAHKLISEFGSVENMYNNLDKIGAKHQELLLDKREQLELSKKLVTIDLNVPIIVNLENLCIQEFNNNALKDYFDELNLVF